MIPTGAKLGSIESANVDHVTPIVDGQRHRSVDYTGHRQSARREHLTKGIERCV